MQRSVLLALLAVPVACRLVVLAGSVAAGTAGHGAALARGARHGGTTVRESSGWLGSEAAYGGVGVLVGLLTLD